MPTTESTIDPATVDELSAAFNRCFETFDAPAGLFTDDAFFDLYPPFWRFQLRGPDAAAQQLRTVAAGNTPSARILRVVPTTTGFVMEHEEHQGGERARRLWLCEVRDGRIASATGYCNGGWDAELRARHAAEAPMLRSWDETA